MLQRSLRKLNFGILGSALCLGGLTELEQESKLLKEGYVEILGVNKGDTRSLDYSSFFAEASGRVLVIMRPFKCPNHNQRRVRSIPYTLPKSHHDVCQRCFSAGAVACSK